MCCILILLIRKDILIKPFCFDLSYSIGGLGCKKKNTLIFNPLLPPIQYNVIIPYSIIYTQEHIFRYPLIMWKFKSDDIIHDSK